MKTNKRNDRVPVRSGFLARAGAGMSRRLAMQSILATAESLETRRLLSLIAPALHSDPGASKQLYLDFVGTPAFTFTANAAPNSPYTAHGAGSNTTPIPAFTMDSDATNFSALELTTIQNIWAVVAEKYSPFNIDVTTVDPGNRTHGVTETAIIGGSVNDWYNQSASGVSAIGGFADTNQSNFCFDFTNDFNWTSFAAFSTVFAGVTAAHEAGHGFGLVHEQSPNSPNTQYYNGNALEAPIMGNGSNQSGTNSAIRATWWLTNEDTGQQSTQPIQDELSILSNSTNGFGYKTIQTSPYTLTSDSSGNLSGSGTIVNATTQTDKFQFTALGPNATITISNATWGGMLAPSAYVTTSTGQSVTSSLTKTNTNCSISCNSLVLGKSYYLNVSSSGGYGNIGSYTIAGTNTPMPDFQPYQPAGWSSKLVVSTAPGVFTDAGSITSHQNVYIDSAVLNAGTSAGAVTTEEILLDGSLVDSWNSGSLPANQYATQTNFSLGKLSGGTHTLEIIVNYNNTASEADTTNNTFTRTFSVTSLSNVWTGNALDGNFDSPSNWSLQHVPTSTEDAVISPSGAYVVTASGNESVYSLSLGTAGGGSSVTLLTSGGFSIGAGGGTINSGAVLTASGDTITGTLANAGTLNLIGGTFNGALTNAGTILALGPNCIVTPAPVSISGSIINVEGTSDYNNAYLTIGGTFTNNGTIELTDDGLGGYTSGIQVSNGTLINTGLITSRLGDAGARTLDGSVDSTSGQISVDDGSQLDVTGSMNIGSGTTMFTGSTSASAIGILKIDALATLQMPSSNFTYTSIAPVLLFATTANLEGPYTFVNQGTLSLYSNVLDAPISNQGTLIANNAGNHLNGTLTTTAGSTIEIDGNAAQNNADLTIAGGFTNNGTIILTNDGSGEYDATLNVSTGTLTNAGIISVPTADHGARAINAILDTTAGNISVSAGVALDLSSGNPVTVGSGTTLTGAGTVHIGGTTHLNIASVGFTYAAGSVPLFFDPTADLSGPGIFTNKATLSLYGNIFDAPIFNQGIIIANNIGNQLSGAVTTAAGSTIEVLGSAAQNDAELTIANGFTSNGAILLTNDGSGAYSATLNVSAGTLNNTGTISVPTAYASTRALNAILDTTAGAISVSAGVALDLSSGDPVTVGSGTTLSGAGTIHIGGTSQMNVSSGGFIYAAGSAPLLFDPTADLAGPGVFTNNGTLSLYSNAFDAPISNRGILNAYNVGNQLKGALTTAAGSTLNVIGNSTQNNADLTITTGFTNNGIISLTNDNSGRYSATLNVSTGALTNAGTISVPTAYASARALNGSVDTSAGIISVSAGVTLDLSSGSPITVGSGTTLTGPGTIHIVGTTQVKVASAGFTYAAGSAPLLFDPAADLVGPGTFTNNGTFSLYNNSFDAPIYNNQGTLIAENIGNVLHGPLTTAIGSLLQVMGNSIQNNADLTVSNGFTNNGTLELTNDNSGGYSAALTVGGVLQNPGVIRAIAAAGGARSINASLANTGTLLVETALTLNAQATVFTTSGSLVLTGGDLTVTNANSISNSGTINFVSVQTFDGSGAVLTNQLAGTITGSGTITDPVLDAGLIAPGNLAGTSFGSITVDGNYQQTTGTLRVTLGGYNSSQYDSLISTNATIGGTLDVHLATGFLPAVGHGFLIMAIPGTGGGAYSAAYGLSISNDEVLAETPSITGVVLTSTANNSTVVSNTNDSGTGSLRQALINATGVSPVITFTSGAAGTISLGGGSLVISKNVTVTGLGATSVSVISPTAPLIEVSGSVTVNLSGLTLNSSGIALQVDAGATVGLTGVTLNGALTTAGILTLDSSQQLTALMIDATGSVTVNHSVPQRLISTLSLAISAGGILDLNDNALVVHNGSVGTIAAQLKSAYNAGAGYWNGTGIRSTDAATNSKRLTSLGILLNNNGAGQPIYTALTGQTLVATDVLVKYTYYGDANLSGAADSADYTRIDAGYLSHGSLTGWSNGDFNYDGVINGSDYTLIDNAFNTQGASLATQIAGVASKSTPALVALPQSQIGSTSANTTGESNPSANVADVIFGAADEDVLSKLKKRNRIG